MVYGGVRVLRLATQPWTCAVAPMALYLTEILLTSRQTLHPKSTPKGPSTTANIPLRWRQRVCNDFPCDKVLFIIERMPYGEPVT